MYKETITQKNEIDAIIEIILEALGTLPPYRVAIGMHRKTLSENRDKITRSETERIVPQQGGLLEKIRGNAEENDDQTSSTAFDFTAA